MSTSLPTPPAGLARVVKAAGDPDITMQALGKLIEGEPSLTASLLGLCNSAAYGVGRPVRSVQQATMVLGTRAIRNIAVSHAVRVATAKVDAGALDGLQFWEDSLRRATAALVLSRRAGFEDPSEAFTVGLIQDLGTLAAAVKWPQHSEALQTATRQPGDERLEIERELIGSTHPEVFAAIGREWGLPEELLRVIASHHADEPLESRREERLRQISRVADAVADVVQTSAASAAVATATTLLAALPSREEIALEAVLEEVAAEMLAASKDLKIEIGKQPTFQELMSNANEALIQINVSYEDLTRRLQEMNDKLTKTLAEKEELARQLKASNEALRRLAATDMLTGVANRRAFTQVLNQRIDEATRTGAPLSLVMLDIDHFKRVNDTHGHAAGDDVLRVTCQRLAKALRGHDLVGRLGGEEFGVLLVGCPADQGRAAADRLREAIKAGPIRCRDGTEISITASFGGLTVQGTAIPNGDDMLNTADQGLYHSKENGRDRVTWAD